MNNRSPDTCLCFVEDAATSSSFCGGMATVSVYLPSAWSVDASSGRRPRVEQYVSAEHSFRCFWKGSTGVALSAHGHRKLQSDDHDDSLVLMRVFHSCTS